MDVSPLTWELFPRLTWLFPLLTASVLSENSEFSWFFSLKEHRTEAVNLHAPRYEGGPLEDLLWKQGGNIWGGEREMKSSFLFTYGTV